MHKYPMFNQFFNSEKSSAALLIFCTIISLGITNSTFGPSYLAFWQTNFAGLSLEHWINDALMAIFFLLIGLELERELYVGELSDFKKALLPIIAALGGLTLPAIIHFCFNNGTPTQAGIGIPMATDIAFALGALALLGNRIPTSLKVLLTAIAVMDDLGAIIVIAVFYTSKLSVYYLIMAIVVFCFNFVEQVARHASVALYIGWSSDVDFDVKVGHPRHNCGCVAGFYNSIY